MISLNLTWLLIHIENFLLVLMRVSILMFFLPPLNSRFIPVQLKVYTVLVLSLILTPVVERFLPPFPASLWEAAQMLISEFVLGLTLFLVVHFLFAGIEMAGQLVGMQMGFGMVTMIDPQAEGQSSLLSGFLYLTAVVLFFVVNGHHLLLRVLVQSFHLVPMDTRFPNPAPLPQTIITMGAQMFVVAIKLLAPVLVALFLIQVALGLVAKTVPQIHILIFSFPLTIGLGLLFLAATLTLLSPYLAGQFHELGLNLDRILRVMQG